MWDLRDVANLDGKREQTAIGQSTTVFLLRIQIRRYGRKLADILAVSPTDLSILVNGKRPWRGNLKEHQTACKPFCKHTRRVLSAAWKLAEEQQRPAA